MSYTKGPWVCGTKGFSFTTDLKSWQVIPVGTRPDPISQDDLNLIAAAPELLEVLQEIMLIPNIEPDGQWFPNFDGIAFSRDSKMWKDVEAAIAKALGKGQ